MTHNVQAFDFSVDLLQALLWQYDNAPRLQTILARKNDWYADAQTQFWDDWERDVFDLTTANDFGLGVWARILNVPLIATVQSSGERDVFGFGAYNLNFNNGNFGRDLEGTVDLNTEQKRLVLRLRYFQLVSTGAVPEVNGVLNLLFTADGGRAWVLDPLDMSEVVYVFDYTPASNVLFVLEKFDLLPRPAGVGSRIEVQPGDRFGFAPWYSNFENSNFGSY